ncbi:MAG: hypothetical protein [Circular genetic element sp.]|nr:MAG: hypothetical protein [Circular genetic element sp.]
MKSFALTLSPAGDITPDDYKKICKLFDAEKWKWIGCRELSGKYHCHFGILAKYSNVGNFGKRVRAILRAIDETQYGPVHAIKPKDWYIGGADYIPAVIRDDSNDTTWEDYLTKDGPIDKGEHWDYTDESWQNQRETLLTANKDPKDQYVAPAWGVMEHWAKHFTALNLPTATTKDIEMGISNICFKHRLDKMPERRKWNELRDTLWMFINKYEGNAWTFCEDVDIETQCRKKRKMDKSYDPRKLTRADEKWLEDISNSVS